MSKVDENRRFGRMKMNGQIYGFIGYKNERCSTLEVKHLSFCSSSWT